MRIDYTVNYINTVSYYQMGKKYTKYLISERYTVCVPITINHDDSHLLYKSIVDIVSTYSHQNKQYNKDDSNYKHYSKRLHHQLSLAEILSGIYVLETSIDNNIIVYDKISDRYKATILISNHVVVNKYTLLLDIYELDKCILYAYTPYSIIARYNVKKHRVELLIMYSEVIEKVLHEHIH